MFVNAQQMGELNKRGAKEFDAICKSHPGCVNCPLKTEDKQYDDFILQCITGRMKNKYKE